jgi:hypothetical protein
MGRPRKDQSLLMNVPLRIMLTAEQKAILDEAASTAQSELSAWARPILLQAAQDQLAKKGQRKGHQK